MGQSIAQQLIQAHLMDGTPRAGEPIAMTIDQTLTQDATGTLVMLELEAMGLERVKTELSAQYVDHNLIQADYRNPDDHLFLQSACRRFGVWFSPPGNGVSHPLHMERFGEPGKTLLGSDSHTCAAGALGMLAMGAGGLAVAMAMAGQPFYLTMPKIVRVELTGGLPDWVSAKDVVLELLRRYGVDGGKGRIFEYTGEGLEQLTAMDRHVIANMAMETGATASLFPADKMTRRFLASQGREGVWRELRAEDGAAYDETISLDLSALEPLIACPSSPGNVVPVREVAGRPLYQAYIGSSANPGYRDFAVAAAMVDGRRVPPGVSLDINPASRQILENLVADGWLGKLLWAGARIHQAGCNGCIGMGQAPASGRISLRTVPRNFPGRSGTPEDQVYLCSPETAAASALEGKITDPRELMMDYPRIVEPDRYRLDTAMLVAPPPHDHPHGHDVELVKGPNIHSLPEFDPLEDKLTGEVLLVVGDDISTDEIMPAGAEILPLRSNIPAISRYVFSRLDEGFYDRAMACREQGGGFVVGGRNYGQGSSREHAALAPRYLGVRGVIAASFPRIHRDNLINFGILPLTFRDPADRDRIQQGDQLRFEGLHRALEQGGDLEVENCSRQERYRVEHDLSRRQVQVLLAGGLINHFRGQGR